MVVRPFSGFIAEGGGGGAGPVFSGAGGGGVAIFDANMGGDAAISGILVFISWAFCSFPCNCSLLSR